MTLLTEILEKNEYHQFYTTYLDLVEFSDIPDLMIKDFESQLEILENIPEEKFAYRYAEGKWSIADLIVHMCDCELVFDYRGQSFSRGDDTKLPGFEQDQWASGSQAERLSKDELIGLFKTTRNHSIALFKCYSDEQLMMIGNANDVTMSVRAIGYIIVGHNRHHFNILKERYLS